MNTVLLTGYIQNKNQIRVSAKGTKFCRNILKVPNDKNESTENIPIVAFGEKALLIDKSNAGTMLEIKGKLHCSYDKEKKSNDAVVFVDEVTLTGDIQSEEAFVDSDTTPVDLPDDDLPF